MSETAIRLGARPVEDRVNVDRALAAFNHYVFLRQAGAPQRVSLPIAQQVVHFLQIARKHVSGTSLVTAYNGPYRMLWYNFIRRATFRAFSGPDLGAVPAQRKNIAQALNLFNQWKGLPPKSAERRKVARQIVSNLRVAINQDRVQIDEIIRAWTNGPAPKAWAGFARRAQNRSQRQQGRGQYSGIGIYDNADLPVMRGSDLSLDGLGNLGSAGGRLRFASEIKARISGLQKDISTFEALLKSEGLDSDERAKYEKKIKYRQGRITKLEEALKEKSERKSRRARGFKSAISSLNPYGSPGLVDLQGDDGDVGDGDDGLGFLGDLSPGTKKGLMLLGGLVIAGTLYHKAKKGPPARKNSRCTCGA